MELGEVRELFESVGLFDASVASLDSAKAGLASVTRLRGWLEARSLAMAKVVRDQSSFPENDLGQATRTSTRRATAIVKRADTTDAVPALGDALASGSVTADHVDVATRALASVEPAERAEVAQRVGSLTSVAERSTPEQFERAVRQELERVRRDDGEERLARQRSQARFRTWTDPITGMGHMSGVFDPETFVGLAARIETMLATKFAEAVPDGCPTDPGAKQDWLRAQAVIAIFRGEAIRSGVPETVIVVDTRSAAVRWPFDVTLPDSALQRFVERSKIHFVDVHGNKINFAPGRLDLGRTTRLANAAQRRALRALYPTCAIPGCQVGFDYTKLHHVTWWRNGGATDLANLIPVCQHHHTRIHQVEIAIHLSPDRTLTVTGRGGTTMTNGPPTEAAA